MDPLEISDSETCVICNRPFKHKKAYWNSSEFPDMLCINIVACHKDCQRARDRVEELKQKLLEARWTLYNLTE